MRYWALFSALLFGCGFANQALAIGTEQTYIDRLKKGLDEESQNTEEVTTESYTQKIRKELEEADPSKSDSSYIERLKSTMPEDEDAADPVGYSDRLREGLVERDEENLIDPNRSAIQDFKDGKKLLEAKRPGYTHHAAGFVLGTAVTRNMNATGGFGVRSYGDVYAGWSPDLRFFYEYQPWHSEWFGNFGFMLNTGFTFANGTGKLEYDLSKPWAPAEKFGTDSRTRLKFITLPLQVGGTFRINTLRAIRPYAQAMIGPVFFSEFRDEQSYAEMVKGYSMVTSFGGGVNIPLNWLDHEKSNSLYEFASIKRYYLTVDYLLMQTLSGPVTFSNNALNLGLTYEF